MWNLSQSVSRHSLAQFPMLARLCQSLPSTVVQSHPAVCCCALCCAEPGQLQWHTGAWPGLRHRWCWTQGHSCGAGPGKLLARCALRVRAVQQSMRGHDWHPQTLLAELQQCKHILGLSTLSAAAHPGHLSGTSSGWRVRRTSTLTPACSSVLTQHTLCLLAAAYLGPENWLAWAEGSADGKTIADVYR